VDTASDRPSGSADPRRGAGPGESERVAAPLPPLLPRDLAGALERLADEELERLSKAVNAERSRRWPQEREKELWGVSKKVPGPALPQAKVNAIRAALKAGVKPTVVARQFGVSPAEIRRALDRE
jgi:hypothetical protein